MGDSPGKYTRVGCCALLQGISPTQGLNPCLLHLLHWHVGSLPLTPLGKPLLISLLSKWWDSFFTLFTTGMPVKAESKAPVWLQSLAYRLSCWVSQTKSIPISISHSAYCVQDSLFLTLSISSSVHCHLMQVIEATQGWYPGQKSGSYLYLSFSFTCHIQSKRPISLAFWIVNLSILMIG